MIAYPAVHKVLRSLGDKRTLLPALAVALLTVAIGTVTAAPALVPVQTSAFTALVPLGWTTEAAADGRAVAALGPAYQLRAATFHPNLSISASPVSAGITLEQAVAVAESGLAKTLPNLRRLGAETAAGSGGPVRVGYYLSDPQGMRLYLVVGVAVTTRWVIATLGATSPDLAAYRDHAALFRASALSVRPR